MQRRLGKPLSKRSGMAMLALPLTRFILQLNWDQSKMGFFCPERKKDFCGINWQCLPQTYVWPFVGFQWSFCWFLSLLLKIQSLLLIIWSVQIYCFQDHVPLEAGWRKQDVGKHSEFCLLFAIIYLFSTDVYLVHQALRKQLKNNC